MAHVELSDSWVVHGAADEVRQQVRDFCRRRKMQVCEERAQRLVAEQGSQLLTRLLGGWFVPADWLPKRATLQFSAAAGEGWRLRVLLEDTLGFGIMDPLLDRKYRTFFEQWLDALQAELG